MTPSQPACCPANKELLAAADISWQWESQFSERVQSLDGLITLQWKAKNPGVHAVLTAFDFFKGHRVR